MAAASLATLPARHRTAELTTPPPRFRPPLSVLCGGGGEEPEENRDDLDLLLLEQAETERGCDWPDGSMSSTGVLW